MLENIFRYMIPLFLRCALGMFWSLPRPLKLKIWKQMLIYPKLRCLVASDFTPYENRVWTGFLGLEIVFFHFRLWFCLLFIYLFFINPILQTIGQAYEDMQTQNQHLLQQVTERDDYNIKVAVEIMLHFSTTRVLCPFTFLSDAFGFACLV